VTSDFLVIPNSFMFGYVHCKNARSFLCTDSPDKNPISSTTEYVVKGKSHGAALDWMY